MAISSINITRTSFNLQTLSLLDSLRQNTLKIFLEQNRLATGNKITAPSDDPVGAGSAVRMTEILDRQEQILANIRYADGFLSATDNAISEISQLLTDAHSIALEMVNSFSSQEQRDSMAEVVKSIIQELVMVGNRTYGDVYLFGGRKTDSVPFSEENGGVVYRGDTKSLTAHVDRFLDAPFNISGDELFGSLSGKVAGWVDLDPSLTGDTRLADMGGTTGRGIDTSGLLRISLDVPAASFTVDLSNADTAQNVIDMINDAAAQAGLNVGPGLDFNVSYNASLNGFQIDVAAGNVSVQDVGGGVTGRDLGLVGIAAGSIVGADLQPRLVPMTTVASLFGGAGAALGSIIITNDNLTATVDLSSAATIQDVLNDISNAGVKVKAQINEAGTGIDVINLVSGLEMRIGEAGDGMGTTEVLGIRSMYANTPLSQLNNGRGVEFRADHDDLLINTKDGNSFTVDLDGCLTVQDVLDRINAAAGGAVTASLALTGNGIRLVDNTGGGGTFSVSRADLSPAIDGLGLEKSTSGNEIVGDDVNGIQPDSVFSALIDLYQALVTGGSDAEQRITAAGARIREFIDHTTRVQGRVGARSQAMSTRLELTEDAVVATQALLSEVKDLDYTEAITRFQQAQTILQANLMTGARLMQLSLMDYL
ncbi:MAG: flagellar hook-associated protein FlgL [Phycisphaerae bacterium]